MKFVNFIFQRENRPRLFFLILFHILIGIVFHLAYPFTVYSYDTPNYMLAAKAGEFLGYRPYGYSAFINLCVAVWSSVYSIVFFQSVLFLLASLYFVFTLFYFFQFTSVGKNLLLLLVCLTLNPFFLNHVLISDSLFTSLSLFWISSFMHIIFSNKLNYVMVGCNLLLCYLAVKVRYAGLILPLAGAMGMLLAYWKKWMPAIIGAVVYALLMLIVYKQGVSLNKNKYGVEIFSAFGGWAQLNNASVTIPKNKTRPRDQEQELLQNLFKRQPDSLFTTQKVLSGNLMWGNQYPEKLYANFFSKRNPRFGYLTCYVYCGKLYNEYASFLKKNNTGAYLSGFFFPNLVRNVYPAKDDINGALTQKFDKNTVELCKSEFSFSLPQYDFFGKIIAPWSGMKYLLLFLAAAGLMFYHRRKKRTVETTKALRFLWGFFLLNAVFLTYTHPVLQRYLILHEFVFIAIICILVGAAPNSVTETAAGGKKIKK